MRGIAILLALVSGCDYLFNADHIDAVAPDAAFDPATSCGNDYTLELSPGSRFRIIPFTDTVWTAYDACNGDSAGASHLAVAPTQDRLDVLIASLAMHQQGTWFIGAVQPITATTPLDDWIWLTGAPVDKLMWSANEPNDANDLEDGHVEQFVTIDQAKAGLIDVSGVDPRRALCECDGHPVSDDAANAIAQTRM